MDPKICKTEILTFFSALFSGRLGLDGDILDEPFEMDETHLGDFLNDDLAKLSDEERDKYLSNLLQWKRWRIV